MNKQTIPLLVALCLANLPGCGSSESPAPAVKNQGTAEDPAPIVKNQGIAELPPTIRPDGHLPRMDSKVQNASNLKQIGRVYLKQGIIGKVNGPEELKRELEDNNLKSPGDSLPYEIVWRADIVNVPEGAVNVLLAWEKNGDLNGGRWCLFADCQTVKFLTAAEFEKTPRVKAN